LQVTVFSIEPHHVIEKKVVSGSTSASNARGVLTACSVQNELCVRLSPNWTIYL